MANNLTLEMEYNFLNNGHQQEQKQMKDGAKQSAEQKQLKLETRPKVVTHTNKKSKYSGSDCTVVPWSILKSQELERQKQVGMLCKHLTVWDPWLMRINNSIKQGHLRVPKSGSKQTESYETILTLEKQNHRRIDQGYINSWKKYFAHSHTEHHLLLPEEAMCWAGSSFPLQGANLTSWLKIKTTVVLLFSDHGPWGFSEFGPQG